MDESLLSIIAATLNTDSGSGLEAVKKEISDRSMFIEVKDLDIDFKERQIVLTVNHAGALFSKCLTLFEDDTPVEVRSKFWNLVNEAENFMAADNLKW
jgi:hypothetical protein